MPLSLTCVCGARLEIDEAFRGQVIECPDCRKPLIALPPPPPPPKKTSGLAIASLLVTFLGAATVIGPAVGVALAFLARRSIARSPDRLAGSRLARAGIFLGAGFCGLGLSLFLWGDRLGLDAWVRSLEWAGKVDYPVDLKVEQPETQGRGFSIVRPDRRWGLMRQADSEEGREDKLILVQVSEDAYIAVLTGTTDFRNNLDECRFEAIDLIRGSLLLKRLGRLDNRSKPVELDLKKYEQLPDTQILELLLEGKLAGKEREFVARVERVGGQLFVATCVARKNRFARLEEAFRRALDSFQVLP